MAKQTLLFLTTGYNNASATFTNADTTTIKTVFTAGANDSDVKAFIICTTDTATVNMQLYLSRGGTDYIIGVITVAAGSGTDGTHNAIDAFAGTNIPGLPIDSAGKLYLPMKNGDTLRAACLATMTSGKTTTLTAIGQDY